MSTVLEEQGLHRTQKALIIKENSVELDFNKIKILFIKTYHCFYTAKETINKTKKPTEWEKTFANDMTDKGLISNIYKQRIQLNIKKNKNRGFPGGAVVENLPANAGNMGSSPGLGRSHMPQSS